MAELDLKLKVQVDTKSAEINLKKTSDATEQLGEVTAETNKRDLSDWIVSVNHAVQSTKNLAIATKDFVANEVGIGEAKESIKGFLLNVTAGFLKLREAFSQEASFSAASRTIEGTDEQLQELNKTINTLASTDLAVTTEELNNVASVAGAMGKSVESIPAFVRTVSEGVVGLAIPAENLAEKLGTLQTQLALSEEGLTSLSDQVNSVADTLPGKVKEIDIFEVLSMGVATAGKQFGLFKGETIALTGTLLSLGEAPETARTGIINLLSALQNAKNQTPDFQAGLAAMGTSAEKLAFDIKAKPLPTLMKLLETMNGMSNAGRLDIATKLLGKGQDAVALTKLVDNTNLLRQAVDTATDSTKYSGSVYEAYSKQIETGEAKITLLWNAIKILSAGIVSSFLPIVKLAIDGFTGIVNAANRFSQNHPIIRTFIEVAGTVLSLAGALRLLGFAMTAVGLLSPALIARMAALASSFLLVSSSVSTAATSLWTFIRTGSALSVVRSTLVALFGGTIGLAVGAIALLAVGIANLLPVTTKWGETTATVGEIIAAMWKTIVDGFAPMADIFSAGVTALDDWLKSLGIAEGIAGALKGSLEFVGVVIVNTGGLFKAFGETIGVVVGSAVEGIAAFSQFTDDVFSGKGIGNSLDTYLKRVKSNVANITESFKKIGEDSGNAVKTFEEGVTKNLQKDPKKLATKDVRGADIGIEPTTGAAVDSKAAEALAKSAEDRMMKFIIDDEAEKIRLYKNTGATQQQIDDFTFQQKLITAQKISTLIKQQLAQTLAATDQDATAKRTALINIESATSQQIKNLTALEQQHRDKATGFLKEIEDLETNRKSKNSELANIGLSGSQLAEQKKQQLAKDTAQLKQLLADKEYTKAAELGKKVQDLAFDNAKAIKEADVKAGQFSAARTDSANAYNASVDLTKQAIQGLADAETQKATIAQTEADKQRVALENVRATITGIDELLTKGASLAIAVDTSQIDKAHAAIDAIPKDVYTTVHTQTVEGRQHGGLIGAVMRAAGGAIPFVKRAAGKLSGFGGGDRIPLLAEAGEYVINKFAVRDYGHAAIDAVNRGNATIAIKRAGGGVVNDQLVLPDFLRSQFANVGMPNIGTMQTGQSAPRSSETIDVNLNIGGTSAVGTFAKNDATAELLAVLKSQKRATR